MAGGGRVDGTLDLEIRVPQLPDHVSRDTHGRRVTERSAFATTPLSREPVMAQTSDWNQRVRVVWTNVQ